MNSDQITPVVLTWNEAPNLQRCLDCLRWAKRVVVVDSGSTDDTAAIAAGFQNVDLQVRPFDDHTTQWNHGLDAAGTEWVLSLDADYVLPAGFPDEIRGLDPGDGLDAFHARFRYCVFGRPLRSSLYPPRAVLFRKNRCRYLDDGHTQLLRIPGASGFLESVIDHDDRKPLSRWVSAQDNYARLEALKMLQTRTSPTLQDRLRRGCILAPLATLFYCLFVRGLILDGWPGWHYTFQRVLAELLLSLRLLEARIHDKS